MKLSVTKQNVGWVLKDVSVCLQNINVATREVLRAPNTE
jgi:hypothetical protein